ncbi:MAG: hypothetical protein IPP29_14025 [Bacteroidetes bacterium]|nr:hypothetical protein [Bacteroidota bacterium]
MNVHTNVNAQWALAGNAIVAANKLGTTNALPLNIVTTNVQRMTVSAAGLVGIGTAAPANLLHVNGVATSTANIVYSKSNYVGATDVRAIDGFSVSNPGYGIGVAGTGGFMGVRGDVTSTHIPEQVMVAILATAVVQQDHTMALMVQPREQVHQILVFMVLHRVLPQIGQDISPVKFMPIICP